MPKPGSPLHGRDTELRALLECVDRAVSGLGQVAFIEGEAGVGKTRLVTELAEHARLRGFSICIGRAEEIERTRPFGAMADAIGLTEASSDPGRARIAALLQGDTRTEENRGVVVADMQYAIVDGILGLVEDMATSGPAVIVLDDLHWADPGSLLVLGKLLRFARELPVLLVGAMRPLPRRPELHVVLEVAAEVRAERVPLNPLGPDAVVALARDLAGGEVGPGLLAQLEGAGGNPLFVIELVQDLIDRGSVHLSGDIADAPDIRLPSTLRSVIVSRLRPLSDDSRDILGVASVLGSSFRVSDLAGVLGRPTADLLAFVREGSALGILDEDGDRLAFRHDVIRDAVYEDLPRTVRAGLHRDAAMALAAAGAATTMVAEHFIHGSVPGDDEALSWVRRAAVESAHAAPGVAIELLDHALDLLPTGDPRRGDLLVEKVLPEQWVGRLGVAEECGREAIERLGHDPARQAVARQRLATVLLNRGLAMKAVEELTAAVPNLDGRNRARALASIVMARAQNVASGISEAAAEAMEAGQAVGDDVSLCAAHNSLAVAALGEGRFEEARGSAERARAHMSAGAHVEANVWHARFVHVMSCVTSDDFDGADRAAEEVRRLSEQGSTPWNLPLISVASAVRRFFTGDWDDAIAEAQTATAAAADMDVHVLTGLASSILGIIAAHRGQRDATAEALGNAESAFARPGSGVLGSDWLLIAKSWTAEFEGDLERARSLLEDGWRLFTRSGLRNVDRVFVPRVVGLALQAGDRDRAVKAVEWMEVSATRTQAPSVSGAALWSRGLLEDDPDLLRRAADLYRRSRRALDLALVCEDAGRALLSAREDRSGREHLEESARLLEGMGATVLLQRVEAELRKVGVRRGTKGPRQRPSTGWESLTKTELQVVELLREGLTNREIGDRMFISRRTVATHLSHVYQKVGVNSRVSLVAELTNLSPATT